MKNVFLVLFLLLCLTASNCFAQKINVEDSDAQFIVKNNKGKFVECLLKDGEVYAGEFINENKFLSQESGLRKSEKNLLKRAKRAKASGKHGKIYEKLVRITTAHTDNYNACAAGISSNKSSYLKSAQSTRIFNLNKIKRPAIWMECSAATDKSHFGVNSPIVFARSGYTKGAANIRILHPICNDGPMNSTQLRNWAVLNLKDPKVDGIGIDHEGWLWAGGEATLKILNEEARRYGKVFISIPKITLELSGRLMPGQTNFATTARILNKYTDGASPWCYSCDNVEYSKFVKLWRASGYTKDLLPMGDPGIRPGYGGINKAMAVKNVNTVADLGLGWALFLPGYDDGTILNVMKKRYGSFVASTTQETNSTNSDGSSTNTSNNNEEAKPEDTVNNETNTENSNDSSESTSVLLNSAQICAVVNKPTGQVCKAKGYGSYIQKQSIKGYSHLGYIYDISYLSYKNSAGAVCRDSCVGSAR